MKELFILVGGFVALVILGNLWGLIWDISPIWVHGLITLAFFLTPLIIGYKAAMRWLDRRG